MPGAARAGAAPAAGSPLRCRAAGPPLRCTWAGGGAADRGGGAVRFVRVVAVRRVVHRDGLGRRAGPRTVDLAPGADAADAQRGVGPALLPAAFVAGAGVRLLLRHPALPG